MKKYLTLLLLMVSVCFYGQETIELKGFYIYLSGYDCDCPVLYKDNMGSYEKIKLKTESQDVIKRLKEIDHYTPFYTKLEGFMDTDSLFNVKRILKVDRSYSALITEAENEIEITEEIVKTKPFNSRGFCKKDGNKILFFESDSLGLKGPKVLVITDNNINFPKGYKEGILVEVKGRLLSASGRYPYPYSKGLLGNDSWIEIIATKITLPQESIFFEDYIKEKSKLKKATKPEPFVAEGFLSGSNSLFFREQYNDSLLLPLGVHLDNNDLLKSKIANLHSAKVRVKGIKNPNLPNTFLPKEHVLITDVEKIGDYEFFPKKELVQYFEGELYFTTNYSFHEEHMYVCAPFKNGITNVGRVFFSDTLTKTPSLKNITAFLPQNDKKHDTYFTHGISIKVKGLRMYGGEYKYLGDGEYRYFIWDIDKINPKLKLWEYTAEIADKKGYVLWGQNKLTFPDYLAQNKAYVFKGRQEDGQNYVFEVKVKGGYLHYVLTNTTTGKNPVVLKGKLILDLNDYVLLNSLGTDAEESFINFIIYESTEPDRYVNGNSLFTLHVYRQKDENGNLKIMIHNNYNTTPVTIKLTEVKN